MENLHIISASTHYLCLISYLPLLVDLIAFASWLMTTVTNELPARELVRADFQSLTLFQCNFAVSRVLSG